MASWTRRSFLKITARSGVAGLVNATVGANPMGLPIGFQVYPCARCSRISPSS